VYRVYAVKSGGNIYTSNPYNGLAAQVAKLHKIYFLKKELACLRNEVV
jgi:hypothetical protein